MTTISWDNFDKAFWVSSTNMRNLIAGMVGISGDLGDIGTDIGNIMKIINGLGPVIKDINDRLTALENGGGGGGGGGGSIDPTDPLYLDLKTRIDACERAIYSHGQSISELNIKYIKLDARVTALENKQ